MQIARTFFLWIWYTLKFSQVLVFGLLSIGLIFVILFNPFAPDPIKVPDNAALVLNLKGQIVEQLTSVDPVKVATAGPSAIPKEVLVSDILGTLERASRDKRITMLYLQLDEMTGALPAVLHQLSAGINRFKESGKTVAAYGGSYSQAQYILAAQADHVFMNPHGATLISGYGTYPLYFAEAIEKLSLTTHIYKVGTYKSAIEPLTRNDMSPADKEAREALLGTLWGSYIGDIHASRSEKGLNLDIDYSQVPEMLRAVGGDFGEFAVNSGLVDSLKSRDEMLDWLVEQVGEGKNGYGYNGISMNAYLKATKPISVKKKSKKDQVAVVYAVGNIVDGDQPAGVAGGDTIARLIYEARTNPNVKAIVLRVDSPGGSAYASEIIRAELARAQKDGIPVVASMGSLAASGGYWISATSDQIWAEPTTITGSIGIFGVLVTAENAMNALGLHSDGVGTTELAGGYSPTRPMNPLFSDIIQQSVERGYERFINLVARGRDMTPEAVDAIGQGRVWAGSTAQELGLVDKLGGLNDAIAAAAELAGLESYNKVVYEEQPSAIDIFVRQLAGNIAANLGLDHVTQPTIEGELLKVVREQLAIPFTLNDPNHIYAVCVECTALK